MFLRIVISFPWYLSPPVSSHPSSPCFLGVGQAGVLVRHLAEHPYAEYHDQQSNRDDDEQGEGEPAQRHGAGPHARPHAAVAEVLRYGARGHGRRVLPQHRHQDEDGRDEDDGQSDLRDGPAGEGLDLAVGALAVLLLVPAGEGGQEEEADEGEDDGDDAAGGDRQGSARLPLGSSSDLGYVERCANSHQVGKDNHVLELAGQPDEVEGVLVDRDLLGQGGGVVGAQPGAAVRVDADAEEAHAGLEVGVACDAGELGVGRIVDLCRVRVWGVVLVVEGY